MSALRDYQAAAVEAVRGAHARGLRRVLVVLPTGTGKTHVFARLPEALALGGRTLVLAHREELLDQAAAKLRAANPHARIGVEQAERRASSEAKIVVASVQTLGRAGSPRLAALDAAAFRLLVVDEAHHATAPSYRTVLEHFRAFEEGGAFCVGFTATPERGDGEGLEAVFEEIVYSRDLPEMVEAGWLSPIRAWRVRTGFDLAGVSVRAGDFAEGELSHAVNLPARNGLAVAAYQAHAEGRRCIAFAADVAHAHDLAEAFRVRGIEAAPVWGEMPREERRDTLARFAAGALSVVTNCGVLTEGFDDPGVSAILMARPTRSPLLYRQCVGRGTRTAPGKADLVLIDLADATRHALVGAHVLYGLPAGAALAGEDLRDVAERVERKLGGEDQGEETTVADALERSEPVNVLSLRTGLPFSRFAWVEVSETRYSLSVGEGERLEVACDLLGAWCVALGRRREVKGGRVAYPSLLAAVQAADGWLVRARPERRRLLDGSAGWRKQPASKAQLDALRKARVRFPAELTKGDASALLARRFARAARRGQATRSRP